MLIEPLAQAVDIDPHGRMVGIGRWLTEYLRRNLGLRRRFRRWSAIGEEVEQIAKAPADARNISLAQPRHLVSERCLRIANETARLCNGVRLQLGR